jgi:hypothetical protein
MGKTGDMEFTVSLRHAAPELGSVEVQVNAVSLEYVRTSDLITPRDNFQRRTRSWCCLIGRLQIFRASTDMSGHSIFFFFSFCIVCKCSFYIQKPNKVKNRITRPSKALGSLVELGDSLPQRNRRKSSRPSFDKLTRIKLHLKGWFWIIEGGFEISDFRSWLGSNSP